MLDKVITYIVCWYNTLYQVLPVTWTNHITTRRDTISRTEGSTWYKVLYQHTMYVMGMCWVHLAMSKDMFWKWY